MYDKSTSSSLLLSRLVHHQLSALLAKLSPPWADMYVVPLLRTYFVFIFDRTTRRQMQQHRLDLWLNQMYAVDN